MVILAARLRAVNSEAADKIEKHLQKIRDFALSDKEPGTSLYYPTRGRDDPLNFLVFEEYADQGAVDAHMAGPLFQAFAAEAGGLVEGGVKALDIQFFNRL